VDRVFGQPGVASAPEHLIAVYAFAFVIYFDFSGYTDMARGLARMLGFELPLNFRTPYLSRSPAEFWRRWHITLSTWLRDYLYIPLGGNRGGGVRTALNLMATMVLGGLWHGAAWTFVAWGALHGAWLVVDRLVRRRARVDAPVTWRDAGRIALCFHVVCALWIPFRAASFEDALTITDRILTGSYLAGWPLLETALIVLCGLLQVAERAVRERPAVVRRALAGRTGALVEGIALGAVAALVAYLGGAGSEFIYFQF
jgi:D-alanyl-lipoteichoic acid acyltransferase DltB (MBOAT superfamily)